MGRIESVLESHGPCESCELSIVQIGLETTNLRANNRITNRCRPSTRRFQAHLLESGEVKVLPRNLQETTKKRPEVRDVVRDAAKAVGTRTAVLDAEVVAICSETGTLSYFVALPAALGAQEAGRGGRRRRGAGHRHGLRPALVRRRVAFRQPLAARRARLDAAFLPIEHRFAMAERVNIACDVDEITAAEMIEQALGHW